jgi:ATP-binding cassette, subfamily B, bacterial
LSSTPRGPANPLSYLPRALRLVWDSAPRWTLAWLALLVVAGVLPAATVSLTGRLVDGLVDAIEAGGAWESTWPVLVLALILAALILLTELLQGLSEWVRTAQAEHVQDHVSALIHTQASGLDLAFYEAPEYYDHLHRARGIGSQRAIQLLQSGGSLLQNGITLLAMAAILLPYGLWVPVALFVSTLPALYVVLHWSQRQYGWWKRTTPDQRRADYHDMVLTHGSVAAELRLFDLGPHFRAIYQSLRRKLRAENLRLTRSRGVARLGAGVIAVLVTGGALLWMVGRALQGFVTLGDLTVFYQAFNRGQSLLRSLLTNAGEIYSNGLFLGNLFEFLELEPRVVSPPDPAPTPPTLQQGLCFREVTFRYPGKERTVLQDFNLEIPAGKVIAIVGPNGAGKSTLVKLMCRFYDPEAGAVELDGLDLRSLALDELRRQITVLFQVPFAYYATARQNIALGDLPAEPTLAQVEAAARGAGAHEIIARLPQGYESPLGTWFDEGNEISAGEWQRIALARAFLRQAPMVILDEPTSFMDSWAEADWLARFRTLVQGRTAILVTHRFTTAMKADAIHVMVDGRIVESGTHQELLARGGRYAQSWAAQMRTSLDPAPEFLAQGGRQGEPGGDGRFPAPSPGVESLAMEEERA